MRVNIGKYRRHLSVYGLCSCLERLGLSEDRVDKITDWLINHTPLQRVFDYVNGKTKRKVKIHVDEWDAWSADHTLSLITYPLLLKLKEDKNASPTVDDDDLPLHMRHGDGYDNWVHYRWEWILNEIIFAHSAIIDDDWSEQFFHGPQDVKFVTDEDGKVTFVRDPGFWFDREGHDRYNERINNGLRLFGKYYRSLWS